MQHERLRTLARRDDWAREPQETAACLIQQRATRGACEIERARRRFAGTGVHERGRRRERAKVDGGISRIGWCSKGTGNERSRAIHNAFANQTVIGIRHVNNPRTIHRYAEGVIKPGVTTSTICIDRLVIAPT